MKKDLDNIKKIIKEHQPELRRRFKVTKIGIFGSYARDEQRPKSDLDVLVTFSEVVSLFTLVGLKNHLEELTGLKVDVVPAEDLRPEFRTSVNKEVIFV